MPVQGAVLEMSAVARDPFDNFVQKLVACIRLLASDKEFEREGALSGVQRLLKSADTNMTNALADHLKNGGLTEAYKQQVLSAVNNARAAAYADGVKAAEARFRPDGQLTFSEVALFAERHINRLPPDKHEFIHKMAIYARQEIDPSPKQGKFLFDLFVQYLGGRIT
jgi:hypothetical protein